MLKEADLIEYENGIVHPGREYRRRQGLAGYHNVLQGIQQSAFEPAAACGFASAQQLIEQLSLQPCI